MKKLLIILLVNMISTFGIAETTQQIIDRLQLHTPNMNVQINGGNCLLPGFKNINPNCTMPLDKATDFILTLQNPGSTIEAMKCDAKSPDQFQNIICTVTRKVEIESDGCSYQDAKYEITVKSESQIQLVSSSPYKYHCD